MTTVADLIEQTRSALRGGVSDKRDRLAGSLTASAGDDTVQLTYNTTSEGLARGSTLEVGTERMYVWQVDESTTPDTLTVERGYLGTTIAEHTSGDTVLENPQWPRQEVYDALLDEVRELNGAGLYAFEVVTLTHSATSAMYELTAPTFGDYVDVHKVEYDTSGLDGSVATAKARLRGDLPASASASGWGLQLLEGGHRSQPMRATMMTTFSEFTADTDDLTVDCGVPVYAESVLKWGAAEQLLIPREARRSQLHAQHGSRAPDEVQSGAPAFAANQFRQRKLNALNAAVRRQASSYPPRNRG